MRGEPGLFGHPALLRTARSSALRKRDRSAFVKLRPPPGRDGSAARRSASRSRVAKALPTFSGVSAAPSCVRTCAPAEDASRRQRDVAGDHHVSQTGAVSDLHVGLIRSFRHDHRLDKRVRRRSDPAIRDNQHAQLVLRGHTLNLGLHRAGVRIHINCHRSIPVSQEVGCCATRLVASARCSILRQDRKVRCMAGSVLSLDFSPVEIKG